MSRVNSLLVLLLVLAPFAHHLVDSLLQQNFKLGFLLHIAIQLGASLLEQFAFIFHLLAKSFDHALISHNFVLFRFLFPRGFEEERALLLRLGQEGLN